MLTKSLYELAPALLHSKETGEVTVLPSIGLLFTLVQRNLVEESESPRRTESPQRGVR